MTGEGDAPANPFAQIATELDERKAIAEMEVQRNKDEEVSILQQRFADAIREMSDRDGAVSVRIPLNVMSMDHHKDAVVSVGFSS
ncbi:MAG: hypothetical protein VW270_14165, partial [Candidatus Poseidoniales archaeon]